MHPASDDPELPSAFVPSVLAYLRGRGRSPEELTAAFGLGAATAWQPLVAMRLSRLQAFSKAAANLVDDDDLGVHAGEHGTAALNLFAFACSGIGSGRLALQTYVRHASSVHDRLSFTLEETAAGAVVRIHLSGHPACLGRHANEHWATTMLLAARQLTRTALRPDHVWLAHAAAGPSRELVRVLGTDRVSFDAGHNAIAFDQLHLAARLQNDETAIAPFLRRLLPAEAPSPPPPDTLLRRVRDAIAARLTGRSPAVEEVARAIGMSGRTLQRRLQAEQLSFGAVLDDLRRDLAVGMLVDGALSLDEVASRVGYARTSALHRAYRRWTGTTPRGRDAAAPRPPPPGMRQQRKSM